MRDRLKITTMWTLLGVYLIGAGSCKYHFWRMEHPKAPAWTFLMQNR